ncbi:MAG TPA: glycosyltransferase family 39 protein [Vicinamibacterales bacterium]
MRASFPSFTSRFLAATGTGALLVFTIIVFTGGFVLQAGPLRFSARRWPAPLLIALAAWTGAALHGRARLADAASAVTRFLDRHATALSTLLAAALAAVGIAHGTYAASSADASGYVSQAHLLSSGRLLRTEPLAREVGWPDAEWTLSPLGYRPGAHDGEIAPTYPPGLPLVMASARAIASDNGPFVVVPLLGAVAVFCTYALGALLHSRLAGLIAAALLATSPIVLFQIVQPMSDVPVTAWWALALTIALLRVPAAPLAAGATTGLAILTRPNLVPLIALVAVALAMRSTDRPHRTRWLPFAAGVTPALGALALVHWRLYGSPLLSGYGEVNDLFSLGAILPNALGYANRIVQGELPALLLAGCSAAMVLFRLKPDVTAARDALVLGATAATLVLACYLPYGVFTEWSYLRFLLPAFPLAFIVVGVVAVQAAARLPEPVRGLILVSGLTVICSVNVLHASREQAFNLGRYEARYRTAGRYLEAALPRNAAIITVQQSGSARYYTGLPVVRWDLLPVDLDEAVATLRNLGQHPILLVEDWEEDALEAKFPRSRLARLDWAPRADFGEVTRVRLYDPSDRDVPTRTPIDRIP